MVRTWWSKPARCACGLASALLAALVFAGAVGQEGAQAQVPGTWSTAGWKTDFAIHSVPLDEIRPGGPPRDGIPPIDAPRYESLADAAAWLPEREPVIAFEHRGQARAYPLRILIWHEIVNDTLGGEPVLVTFCPLCNTAIAFARELDGVVYDFGTTGNLRHSDLVMWDRQTESWWQQITGEAIVGKLTGKVLRPLPAQIVSFAQFRATYPQGDVLSQNTGFRRPYGQNPYLGYDDIDSSPFLYSGPHDGRLRPMERVVTVALGGEAAAYPFSLLKERGVVEDTVGGQPIVVVFQRGATSPLDGATIASSREVGGAGVFDPRLDGRHLHFRQEGEAIVDRETGSQWNLLGHAIGGPLAGRRLTPVVSGTHFWFAWSVFQPATRVYAEPAS